MADFFVRHGLNPDKVVRFTITLTQVHDVGYDPSTEPLADDPRIGGDIVWILEIGTNEPHKDTGDAIPTRKIHLTTLSHVDDEINKVVEEMCDLVDWGDLKTDAQAPYVYWYLPNEGSIEPGHYHIINDVPITMDVYIKIRDSLPAVGIDFSSIEMELEVYAPDDTPFTFDITSEVEQTGSPYDLQLYWHPLTRVWDEYGG